MISATQPASIPQPARNPARWVCLGLLAFLGLGALAGGVALVAKPDGSVMHLPLSYLEGSPFPDFLVPGLILGGLFGVGSYVVAWLGWRNTRPAPFLAFAIGCAMMIWIVVELAIIKDLSFLHPLFFCVGLAIAAMAVPWGWPTFRGWRTGRG
jgi:hypothetical protein